MKCCFSRVGGGGIGFGDLKRHCCISGLFHTQQSGKTMSVAKWAGVLLSLLAGLSILQQ
jgi:hypothetical protein